jgi:hypothetical protein
MNSRSLTSVRIVISAVVAASVACTDAPTVMQNSAKPSASAAPHPWVVSAPPTRTIDDDFADLVDEIPGFGGAFVDSSGVVNVWQTNASRTAASPGPALAAFARRHSMGGLAEAAERTVQVREAAFDFRALQGWRRTLVREMDFSGVLSLDVDERTNRVLVGVRDDQAAQAVAQQAKELGIPAQAVHTIIEQPPELMTTLQDSTNRVAGLSVSRTTVSNGCTMGPLVFFRNPNTYAVDSSLAYFVTNSHCSEELFAGSSAESCVDRFWALG